MLYFLVLAEDARKSVQITSSRTSSRGCPPGDGRSDSASVAKERLRRHHDSGDRPSGRGLGPQHQRHLPVHDRAAPIAKPIHDAQNATFDLLRAAGVVAPELEKRLEGVRSQRRERMIVWLQEAGRRGPRPNEGPRHLLDAYITRHIYRMLVCDRGWPSQKYQDWLADTLVRSLLGPHRRSRKAAT